MHFKGYRQHCCFRQLYKTNYLIEWLAISHRCLWQMYQLKRKKILPIVLSSMVETENFSYYPRNAVFCIAPASLRNVCPSQFHFLLFIWISIGFCLVILHSSSFVILSVHFIFIIRLMHLFMNVCNLLVIWSVVTGPFASHLLFSRQKLHCTLYSPQPFFIGCTTWWWPVRGRNM